MSAPVVPVVLCTDAEGPNNIDEGGFGVMISEAAEQDIRQEYRYAERKGAYVRLDQPPETGAELEESVLDPGPPVPGSAISGVSRKCRHHCSHHCRKPNCQWALVCAEDSVSLESALRSLGWEVDCVAPADLRWGIFPERFKACVDLGCYDAVHLELPPTSWANSARPPLRSFDFIYGLPTLDDQRRRLVEEGNSMLKEYTAMMESASRGRSLVSLSCGDGGFQWRSAELKKLLKRYPWKRWRGDY